MFRSKSIKLKTGLIYLNVLFTLFVQFLVENHIFKISSFTIEQPLKLKCSAEQILAMISELVSFYLLQVAIRSFSNN